MIKEFPPFALELNEKDVQVLLGYPRYFIVEEPVQSYIKKEILQGRKLIKPVGVYAFFTVKNSSGSTITVNGKKLRFKDKKLIKEIKEVEKLVFFLVTLGDILEKKVKKYFSTGEFERGTILDAVGTAFIKSFSEKARNFLEELLKKQGHIITSCYSLDQVQCGSQTLKTIFELCKASKIGIFLTEGLMFKPRKSKLAVLGWRKQDLN